MDFTKIVKNNLFDFKNDYNNAIRKGLEAIGLEAEGYAKDYITDAPAVDTGRLRNSITYALSGEEAHVKSYSGDNGEQGGIYVGKSAPSVQKAVYLGTNVEYAAGIEFGTHRKAGAVMFLHRAATEHTDRYRELMKEAFKEIEDKSEK